MKGKESCDRALQRVPVLSEILSEFVISVIKLFCLPVSKSILKNPCQVTSLVFEYRIQKPVRLPVSCRQVAEARMNPSQIVNERPKKQRSIKSNHQRFHPNRRGSSMCCDFKSQRSASPFPTDALHFWSSFFESTLSKQVTVSSFTR